MWQKNSAKDKHVAFTLAEVLITLAVIGIVAVLTIPALIQQHEEKTTIIRLKKAYAVLSQAVNLAILENGTPDKWGLNNKTEIRDEENKLIGYDVSGIEIQRKYITKFIKGENCSTLNECSNLPPKHNLYNLSMKSSTVVSPETTTTTDFWPYFRMDDGTVILFLNVIKDSHKSDISIFIPTKKGIYRRGVNSFMFNITPNGLEVPGSMDETQKYTGDFPFKNYCNLTYADATNGWGCTAWVIQNGNMDYLRCDDLSWSGKHKCSK